MDVQMIQGVVKGAVICEVDGVRKEYDFLKAPAVKLVGRYNIASVWAEARSIVVVLEEDMTNPNNMNAEWVKRQVARFGNKPNTFDG